MPADHSKHKFLHDIGTDWVALGPTGIPLARAATEAGVRRAVPDAAEYITGKQPKAEKPEPAPAPVVAPEVEPAPAVEPPTEPVSAEPPADIVEPEVEPKQEEPADIVEPEVEPKQEEPADIVEPEVEPKQEEPDDKPQLDHDGDGKPGGSEKGDNATASRSRRQRRPA